MSRLGMIANRSVLLRATACRLVALSDMVQNTIQMKDNVETIVGWIDRCHNNINVRLNYAQRQLMVEVLSVAPDVERVERLFAPAIAASQPSFTDLR